jgi:predicted DCC family thiol-disulfide oxidoreductase YuxK
MGARQTINIIYDGECGFCVRSLRVVRALDVRGALRLYDSHSPETFERFPVLRGADVQDAMYAFAEGETPQRGYFAFRRLLWTSPLMWPLIPLFYFPGVGLVGPRVYAWVARHRKSFGCESDFCALPASGPRAGLQHEE